MAIASPSSFATSRRNAPTRATSSRVLSPPKGVKSMPRPARSNASWPSRARISSRVKPSQLPTAMFAQALVDHRVRQTQQPSRFPCTRERTHKGAYRLKPGRRAQGRHLEPSRLAQRNVLLALETAFTIPLGWAVANEGDAQFVFPVGVHAGWRLAIAEESHAPRHRQVQSRRISP